MNLPDYIQGAKRPSDTCLNTDQSSAHTATYPPLSIGVVTHQRANAFAKLLDALIPAIAHYPAPCELIVVNNSGPEANTAVEAIVQRSGIENTCDWRVVDSPQNSISVGRNLVLESSMHKHLVFVDDDEYPVEHWLTALVDTMNGYQAALVAGPIVPVFPDTTTAWVRGVDLHNARGLRTGQRIDYAATGNFLFHRSGSVRLHRFDEAYGQTGGEDTEFFLRLKDLGLTMVWSEEAVVFEDIPPHKASALFIIRRFMSQGRTYRTILESRGERGALLPFAARAALLSFIALAVGMILLVVRPRTAGNWLKRGFANLGKIVPQGSDLYR